MRVDRRPVVFDLDQTIQPWDMQLLFANWILRGRPWRLYYLLFFLPLLPFAWLLGAGRMKQVFLCFLWGIPERVLRAEAVSFVEHYIPRICYKELQEAIARHKEEGRMLLLCSASPELYVVEVGRRLGFDLVLGTRFDYGAFFPRMLGSNNKGEEKVRRIREAVVLGEERYPLAAGYGDSKGDLEMLDLCEEVTCVNPSPEITELAKQRGWGIIRPERPFRSRGQVCWAVVKQLLGVYSICK